MHYLTKYAIKTISQDETITSPEKEEKFPLSKTKVYKNLKFDTAKNISKSFKSKKTSKDIITAHSLLNIEYNAIFSYSLIFHNFFSQKNQNLTHFKKILQIIHEETIHYMLLDNYLQKRNFNFGDFSVSNNILKDLEKVNTFLEHICLISLCHESKGIDAGPFLLKKLNNSGFLELEEIVSRILRDEENHVGVGVEIYKSVCREEILEEETFFRGFVKDLNLVPLRPNLDVRKKIGFDFYD